MILLKSNTLIPLKSDKNSCNKTFLWCLNNTIPNNKQYNHNQDMDTQKLIWLRASYVNRHLQLLATRLTIEIEARIMKEIFIPKILPDTFLYPTEEKGREGNATRLYEVLTSGNNRHT